MTATPKAFPELAETDGSGNVSTLPSADLQRLWFATLKKEWSSLVVLPAHPEGSASFVARSLAQIGSLHRDGSIKLISAEGVGVSGTSRLIIDMTSHVSSGGMVIVVLDSVLSNPTGIPVALAADAVLLCVHLGETETESARRTIEMIGADRFVGAVAIRNGRK